MVWQSVIDKIISREVSPTDVAGKPKTNQSDEGDDVYRRRPAEKHLRVSFFARFLTKRKHLNRLKQTR